MDSGIRKTTSIYQPWFPELLLEALLVPNQDSSHKSSIAIQDLPIGSNSFFRQLDHMITTLCNVDFRLLYQLANELIECERQQKQQQDESDPSIDAFTTIPSPRIVQQYSNLKAAIFTRYRTLSELLGAHLLYEAQKSYMNCMLETSGRDVAMFHYIDHFFPNTDTKQYRKLALHFTINDLSLAQSSVDQRMIHEIQSGIRAIGSTDSLLATSTMEMVRRIIQVNEGGPYGSEVLPDIQIDSDRVWNDMIHKSSSSNDNSNNNVGHDWYKASIQINAHPTEAWTAQAIRPDGTLGTLFTFVNKK
jgi:hypothetical protein